MNSSLENFPPGGWGEGRDNTQIIKSAMKGEITNDFIEIKRIISV